MIAIVAALPVVVAVTIGFIIWDSHVMARCVRGEAKVQMEASTVQIHD